ncbi:MAG TPA: nuclear transport factor 2 family protein, partial [Pyrinomonadaceae bacterium]|nr:nuclear transport factor 2 family protein [Pyrinomonadaceae bacterium]
MSDESHSLSKAETEELLLQMTDEWAKALVRGDGDALGQIMADDFYFAYPFEGDGKEQFIDDVTSGEVKVEHLSRENVNVHVWGDAAVLTGKDSARWFYKGHDYSGHYKVMHVYSLRNEKWQLVSVQA